MEERAVRRTAAAIIVFSFSLTACGTSLAEQRGLLAPVHAMGRFLGIGYSAGYYSQRPTHSGPVREASGLPRNPERAQPDQAPQPLPPVVRQQPSRPQESRIVLPSLLDQAMRDRTARFSLPVSSGPTAGLSESLTPAASVDDLRLNSSEGALELP